MQVEITTNAGSFAAVAIMALLCFATWGAGYLVHRRALQNIHLTSPIFLTLILSLTLLGYRIYADVYLVGDEITWHLDGLLVSQHLYGGAASSIEGRLADGKEGYAWLIGVVYSIAGPVPLILIVINILLTLLLIPIWVRITLIVADQLQLTSKQAVRAAKIMSYGLVFVPVILFWSPRLLREIPSMFLIATAMLFVLQFIASRRISSLFLGLITATLMASVRLQIGIGLFAAIALSLIIVWSSRFHSRAARIVVLLPFVILCLFFTWSIVSESADLSVESAIRRNRALTNATSAFSGAGELQSAGSILEVIVFNLPRILFGPFLHEINSSSVMLLAAVSNVFWIATLLFATRAAWHGNAAKLNSINWASILVIVTFTLMLIAALSITAGNYGLVVRMRLMPFATLLPLAAIGLSLRKGQEPGGSRRKKRSRHLSVFAR